MADYVLSCCSTADLTQEYFQKRNISYICFHFELDGKLYDDDLGKSVPFEQFYQAMTDGAETKTSQVNVDEFCTYFDKILQEGHDILHLTLSSGITGVYNSACLAQQMMQEKYPDRKIYIVDSLAASSGFGLLMDKLADLRDEGMSIDELLQWTEIHKRELNHWFFTTDLTFFIKGGRVSKAAGMIGGAMNICPLMRVDSEGKLVSYKNVRTKKKVIHAIVDQMEEKAQGGLEYSGKCFICNSACMEDAKAVAKLVEERFPRLSGKVEIFSIGTTIGSHTGPGTVALFFWGNPRIS